MVANEPRARRGAGFTYVFVLILVAVMSVGVLAASQVWSQAGQRERELELLFAGRQFREAIGSYYEKSPGGAHVFPERLEDLLEDTRLPSRQRWLRRLYPDPMTGKAQWGLLRTQEGRIKGVYSLSQAQPIKRKGFAAQEGFENAPSYAEWKFVYEPGSRPAASAM